MVGVPASPPVNPHDNPRPRTSSARTSSPRRTCATAVIAGIFVDRKRRAIEQKFPDDFLLLLRGESLRTTPRETPSLEAAVDDHRGTVPHFPPDQESSLTHLEIVIYIGGTLVLYFPAQRVSQLPDGINLGTVQCW